jgi:hypothetical protein
VIALLAGLAILGGGGLWMHRNYLDEFLVLIAKSKTADGTVVENRPVQVFFSSSSRKLPFTAYRAIVHFNDNNGQLIKLNDHLAFNPPSFNVGQKVRVLYDPDDAQHAMIDRGPKNFVIPAICLLFGGLMVLGGSQRLLLKK